eukprot:SAG22_NODE_226_length_14668_cov_29.647495_10_plen_90_part_00
MNSHSTTVAEQLSYSGYDWLLVDTQHGPMTHIQLSAMIAAIANGGAKSMVRVSSASDRDGIQQALDVGADGGKYFGLAVGSVAVSPGPI